MKQTAVEFLIEEIKPFLSMPIEDAYKTILQAKAMEKEQIIEAYAYGVKETRSRCEYEDFNEYYNETFKSE